MVNELLLNDAIIKSGIKQGKLAEGLGISRQALNNKLTGKNEFTLSEVEGLAIALGITREEIPDYFFI